MAEERNIWGVAGRCFTSGRMARGFRTALLAVLAVSSVGLAGCAGGGDRRSAVRESVPFHEAEPVSDSIAAASAPARVLPDSAGFVLERTEHDFGQLALGATVSTTFRLEAQGGSVVVLSASTDCGCTRAEIPKRPLRPGDTVQVKVLFAARDKGNFYKTVHLRLHAGGRDRTVELKVRGTVQ